MNHKHIAIPVLSIALVTVSCTVHAQDAAAATSATKKSDGLDLVNVAAVAIALAALWVSIREGRAARRHDLLSVKPLLDSEALCGPANERFQLNLVNNGLGPAIIKKMELLVDGEPYQGPKQFTDDLKFPQDVSMSYFTKDSILTPEKPLELIGYLVKPYNEQSTVVFKAAVSRIKYRIRYETLYGEPASIELNGTDVIETI